MSRDTDRTHDSRVVAAFSSPERAREALDRAERLGVDGSRLVAVRVDRRDPADPAPSGGDETDELLRAVQADARRDDRILRFVGERLLAGGVLGAIVGAAIGVLAVVAIGAIDTSAGAIVLAALAGVLAGSLLGAIAAGVLAAPTTPSWERTLADGEGRFVVSAHPEDLGTLERLVAAWKRNEPSALIVTEPDDRV